MARANRTVFFAKEHEKLKTMFVSRPRRVLAKFKHAQVGSLMEMDLFQEIIRETPEHAARIALEAQSMGIAIEPAF